MVPRIPWKNLGNPLEISLIVKEIQKFPIKKKQTKKQYTPSIKFSIQ